MESRSRRRGAQAGWCGRRPRACLDPGRRRPDAAERDCKALVTTGWYQAPSAAQNAENLALMLRLAKCMRAHGVPNFPDPTSKGLTFSPSSGINPNSPAFLAGQKRCQRDSLTLGGGS